MSNYIDDVKIVMCRRGCNGNKTMCLPEIQEIVDSGGKAGMVYSHHVHMAVTALGYETLVKSTTMDVHSSGGVSKQIIPVFMTISKKGERV